MSESSLKATPLPANRPPGTPLAVGVAIIISLGLSLCSAFCVGIDYALVFVMGSWIAHLTLSAVWFSLRTESSETRFVGLAAWNICSFIAPILALVFFGHRSHATDVGELILVVANFTVGTLVIQTITVLPLQIPLRWAGFRIQRGCLISERPWQFRIKELLYVTTAVALVCGFLRLVNLDLHGAVFLGMTTILGLQLLFLAMLLNRSTTVVTLGTITLGIGLMLVTRLLSPHPIESGFSIATVVWTWIFGCIFRTYGFRLSRPR